MKTVFNRLGISVVAAIAGASFSVLVSGPAHALPCDPLISNPALHAQCVAGGNDEPHYQRTQVADANDGKPVCQWSSPTGDTLPCTSCLTALGPEAPLADWACGRPGATAPSGYQTPPCRLGEVSTHQPGCAGVMQPDGSIIASG
jgi:hypothetical protein